MKKEEAVARRRVCLYGRPWIARAVFGLTVAVLISSSTSGCCTECMRCLVGCYDSVDDGRNRVSQEVATAGHLGPGQSVGMAY